MGKYDELFKDFSDMELVLLQKKASEYPEDEEFRNEVLIEIGKRHKKILADNTPT